MQMFEFLFEVLFECLLNLLFMDANLNFVHILSTLKGSVGLNFKTTFDALKFIVNLIKYILSVSFAQKNIYFQEWYGHFSAYVILVNS